MNILAAAVPVITALSFWWPNHDAFGFTKILPASAILFVIWLHDDQTHRPLSYLAISSMALFSYHAAALSWSVCWRDSLVGCYGQPFYGAMSAGLLLAAFLGFRRLRIHPAPLFSGYCLALVIVGSVAIPQAFAFDPIAMEHAEAFSESRAYSTMGSPVFLGAFCAIGMGPALWLVRARTEWWRYLPAMMGAAACISARSRAGVIGCLCAAAAFMIASGKIRGRALAAAMAAILLAGGILIGKRAQSDHMRVELWRVAVTAFKEHPVLGSGPDTFLRQFVKHRTEEYDRFSPNHAIVQASAHNDILQSLVTLGAVGTAIYLMTLALAVRLAGRCPAALAMMAGFWVCAELNVMPTIPGPLFIACVLGVLDSRDNTLVRGRDE